MKLYLIFLDQAVNCIVNNANGNILTNGKCRCYNDENHRICCRRKELQNQFQKEVINTKTINIYLIYLHFSTVTMIFFW